MDPLSFLRGNSRGLAGTSKTFRHWNVEQHWLLPPSVLDFVPVDHIAQFIRDTVREQPDLSAILAPYEQEERCDEKPMSASPPKPSTRGGCRYPVRRSSGY